MRNQRPCSQAGAPMRKRTTAKPTTLTKYVATNSPIAPEGLLRPTKWPTARLMAKNAITRAPPKREDQKPTAPLKMKAATAVSTSAAPEAAELTASSRSHKDFVGPETPTGPLPEAGPG